MAIDPQHLCIYIKREQLTKTFMKILNLKNPLFSMVYTKNISAL